MSIFVQSLLGALVIDVERNQDLEGALTDADTMKLKGLTAPPTPAQLADAANQLWDFVDGPFPNSFFIQSAMKDVDGKPLVLDIKGGKPAIGAEVQVNRKKDTTNAQQNEGARNQLWQWKAPPNPLGPDGPGPDGPIHREPVGHRTGY